MTRRRLRAALVVLALATSGMAIAQEPTPATSVSGSIRAAAGALTDADKTAVDDFLKAQAAAMITSPDEPQATRMPRIRAARDNVAYQPTGATPAFQQYYAQSLAANFLPDILSKGDSLVQVNAALAVSSIRSLAILPNLAQLAGSGNAGVRYLAVKACVGLREPAVTAGPQQVSALINVLQTIGARETNLPTVALILQSLNFTAAGGLPTVPDPLLAAARGPAAAALGAILAAQARQVRDAQAGACAAMSEAAKTAGALAGPSSEAVKAQLLRGLANLMCQAGYAYQQQEAENPASPPAELVTLLKDIEAAFQGISGIVDASVGTALVGPAPRGAAVLAAVNGWVGTATSPGRLSAAPWSVQAPTPMPASAPTSRPATRPAATRPVTPP